MAIVRALKGPNACVALLVATQIVGVACAPSARLNQQASLEIEVEGLVSVRGNEPFTGLVLETPGRNTYVLVSDDREVRAEIQRRSPGRFRVSGVVFKGSWQGRDRAHLRVRVWERIDM